MPANINIETMESLVNAMLRLRVSRLRTDGTEIELHPSAFFVDAVTHPIEQPPAQTQPEPGEDPEDYAARVEQERARRELELLMYSSG